MTWVRLDEQFANEPKVVAAGPLGMALHVAALCYINTNLTDGYVPRSIARRLIDLDELPVAPDQVIAGLVDAGLWSAVDGGYQVHDDNQPTKAEVLAQREQKAAAGRKGGKATQAGAKASAQARDQAGAQARASGSTRSSKTQARTRPVPETEPQEGVTVGGGSGGNPSGAAAQARPESVDTRAVFDAWRQSTGRTSRTRLDDKRRRAIQRALRAYPLDDVLAAVTGWRNDPWPDRVRHNDLTVLLRDAAHIEKFRDLASHGPSAPAGPPSGFGRQREQLYANDQAAQAWVAMQQEPQHDHDPGGLATGLQPHQRELARPAAPA